MTQKIKDKGTNNDLQNITQQTKDRAIRTLPKTGSELSCSVGVSGSCSTCGTCRDCCKRQSSAISWREQVRFDDRDDDDVRFVPDSTLSYIYISLKLNPSYTLCIT
jgi:4-diphosphocytidyl-2C-methyl-D-erythritol kinase